MDQIVTNLTLNGFADDHSIKKKFMPSRLGKDETETIKIMESSMVAVKGWMDSMHLKMMQCKAEFIYLGSTRQLGKYSITWINVNGEHKKKEATRLDTWEHTWI